MNVLNVTIHGWNRLFCQAKPWICGVFWVYILAFLTFLASARCMATNWSIYLNERFERLKRSPTQKEVLNYRRLSHDPKEYSWLPKLLKVTGMFARPISQSHRQGCQGG